jgi:hypothetical protein
VKNKDNNQLVMWENLELGQADLDFIYNFLLEKEKPMTTKQLARAIIEERVRLYKKELLKQEKSLGKVYRPQDDFKVGEEIVFPLLENQKAAVTAVREGRNPDISTFKVVTFRFGDGVEAEYAGSLAEHDLNTANYWEKESTVLLDSKAIISKYGRNILRNVQTLLSKTDELFTLADLWFSKSLMAEIIPGYLNLAEAMLEMEEGIPVPTSMILEAIDYPVDTNESLTEFSFNYAMFQDDRFDQVGSTGNVLWTLKLLEPEDVRKKPLTLKYYGESEINEKINQIPLDHLLIHDELDPAALEIPDSDIDSFNICITYPHWKAGTLPLIGKIHSIFPTAIETDKVVFEFYDRDKEVTFPGWVLIKENYVSGLKKWYRERNVIPGSLIHLSRKEDTAIVEISLIPPHSSKDWVRTALFDPKGRMYFEVRQQSIASEYDDRMCIHVENSPQLDVVWDHYNKPDINFNRILETVFKDISSENPQGIVHFQEIYSAVNMMYRCPPRPLLQALFENNHYEFLDDLYFKMSSKESVQEASYD